MTTVSARTAPYDELDAAVRGDLITPSDPRYDQARAVYNTTTSMTPPQGGCAGQKNSQYSQAEPFPENSGAAWGCSEPPLSRPLPSQRTRRNATVPNPLTSTPYRAS